MTARELIVSESCGILLVLRRSINFPFCSRHRPRALIPGPVAFRGNHLFRQFNALRHRQVEDLIRKEICMSIGTFFTSFFDGITGEGIFGDLRIPDGDSQGAWSESADC